MQVNGLPVFYKQRLRGLYPSWAYTAPGVYLRVYYSATEALIWSCIVYWLVGFAPDAGRQAFFAPTHAKCPLEMSGACRWSAAYRHREVLKTPML